MNIFKIILEKLNIRCLKAVKRLLSTAAKMMPCDILEGSTVEKAIDAVLVLVFIIYSISLIIICRVKYRDEMIICLADYEYMKNQR